MIANVASALAQNMALELAATLPGVPLYLASGFAVTQEFHLDLPDDIKLPLARMHKRL